MKMNIIIDMGKSNMEIERTHKAIAIRDNIYKYPPGFWGKLLTYIQFIQAHPHNPLIRFTKDSFFLHLIFGLSNFHNFLRIKGSQKVRPFRFEKRNSYFIKGMFISIFTEIEVENIIKEVDKNLSQNDNKIISR